MRQVHEFSLEEALTGKTADKVDLEPEPVSEIRESILSFLKKKDNLICLN